MADFIQAVKWMKQGKIVKRKCWVDGSLLKWDSDGEKSNVIGLFLLWNEDEHDWEKLPGHFLTIDMILKADDWAIHKEAK